MLLAMVITVALIFLALSGMPIFAVIAAAALVGFYLSDIEVTVVAIELYRIVDTPMLRCPSLRWRVICSPRAMLRCGWCALHRLRLAGCRVGSGSLHW